MSNDEQKEQQQTESATESAIGPARPVEGDVRTMLCSFCGFSATSRGIGAVYCGPHKISDTYFPAIRMTEVSSNA